MCDDACPNLPGREVALSAHLDEGRFPLSLRVLGFSYILIGTLSIVEMVLQRAVFGGAYVDVVGLLTILIGRGLLLWRETSRRWAVFLRAFCLTTACCGLVVAILDVFAGSNTNLRAQFGPWSGGSRLAVVGAAMLGVFSVWQLYVLERPGIVRRFKAAQLERRNVPAGRMPTDPGRRWQFSLGSLLLFMLTAAFIVARLTAEDVVFEVRHLTHTWSNGGVIHSVEYAVRSNRFSDQPDQLLYAILSSDNDKWTKHIFEVVGGTSNDAWINSPDGRRIALPAERQLYEIHQGRLSTRDDRITIDEFDDYMALRPTEWNLESLLAHVRKKREVKAEQSVNSEDEP